MADLARFAAWWISDSDAVVPAALRREAATSQTAVHAGRDATAIRALRRAVHASVPPAPGDRAAGVTC